MLERGICSAVECYGLTMVMMIIMMSSTRETYKGELGSEMDIEAW